MLSIKEIKKLFRENGLKKDPNINEKTVRFFFNGVELKDSYKLGSVINKSLINMGILCVIAVYCIKYPVKKYITKKCDIK